MRNSVLFPCVYCVFIEVWKHNLMKLKFLENFQSSAHSCVKIELITKQRVVKSCLQLLHIRRKENVQKNLPFEYSFIITDSTYNIWKWISLSWITIYFWIRKLNDPTSNKTIYYHSHLNMHTQIFNYSFHSLMQVLDTQKPHQV